MNFTRSSTTDTTWTLDYDLLEEIIECKSDCTLTVTNLRGSSMILSKNEVFDCWASGQDKLSCRSGVLVRVMMFKRPKARFKPVAVLRKVS